MPCGREFSSQSVKHKDFLTLLRQHVLKDIDPYICLFEDCNKPNEHFKNVGDWMNHMKWQHTITWSCQASSHRSILFDSKIEFEQHMKQKHCDTFTESQLPLLIQKCAHPAPDTFRILTTRTNTVASGSRYECPLCAFFVEKSDGQNNPNVALLGAELPVNEAAKTIENHIAAHLESIALLSLPEQDGLDDGFSIARDSEDTKRSSTLWNVQETSSQNSEEEQDLSAMDLGLEEIPSEGDPESLPETADGTWAYIFASLGLRKTSHFDPAHDVNLRGFVERARHLQMISYWTTAAVPILIIYDPEGIEIAVFDPKQDDETDLLNGLQVI